MLKDFSYNVNCDSVLFADDTSIWSTMKDPYLLPQIMKFYLREAADWFESNGFKLNLSKTQRILFTLKNVPEELISEVNLLGIT